MWIQLWVNATQAQAEMLDELVQRFGALFCAPDGKPIASADGTYEVRILDGSESAVRMVTGLMAHYGVTVVRRQDNPQ